jgi:hypothetical protein
LDAAALKTAAAAAISDNLLAWLNPQRKTSGAIGPERDIDVFSERLHELAAKAKITPWPHNAMRHSFGSYFLGRTKDENLTASEMGNSPEVIIKHYRVLVRDAEVTRYWRLTPGNIEKEGAITPTPQPAWAARQPKTSSPGNQFCRCDFALNGAKKIPTKDDKSVGHRREIWFVILNDGFSA